jgi:hypothetical protein
MMLMLAPLREWVRVCVTEGGSRVDVDRRPAEG